MKSFIKLISFLWDDIHSYLIQNETTNYPYKTKIEYQYLVGKVMASQSCPNPKNLWICYITLQRVIKIEDRIRFAKIGRLFWVIQVGPM